MCTERETTLKMILQDIAALIVFYVARETLSNLFNSTIKIYFCIVKQVNHKNVSKLRKYISFCSISLLITYVLTGQKEKHD